MKLTVTEGEKAKQTNTCVQTIYLTEHRGFELKYQLTHSSLAFWYEWVFKLILLSNCLVMYLAI